MAPPRTGPRTADRTKTTDTIPTYVPHFSGGTISGLITDTIAYIPDAPTPCRDRKMILEECQGRSLDGTRHLAAHSSIIEETEPQTMEKMVKRAIPRRSMTFRPIMSLNLAYMTRNPGINQKRRQARLGTRQGEPV